jgi:hypothetical protein
LGVEENDFRDRVGAANAELRGSILDRARKGIGLWSHMRSREVETAACFRGLLELSGYPFCGSRTLQN